MIQLCTFAWLVHNQRPKLAVIESSEKIKINTNDQIILVLYTGLFGLDRARNRNLQNIIGRSNPEGSSMPTKIVFAPN